MFVILKYVVLPLLVSLRKSLQRLPLPTSLFFGLSLFFFLRSPNISLYPVTAVDSITICSELKPVWKTIIITYIALNNLALTVCRRDVKHNPTWGIESVLGIWLLACCKKQIINTDFISGKWHTAFILADESWYKYIIASHPHTENRPFCQE